MLVRRYGATIQSVVPNFDAHAMNEVGFLREGGWSLPVGEFESAYVKGEVHELSADAEGGVQGEVEAAVLDSLREKLARIQAGLGSDEVLMVENEPSKDQPKTRSTQTTSVVGTENRLYFQYTVDPPLRVAIWRRS
jgi:hypothetical protein